MTTLSGRITVHGAKPTTSAVVELHNPTGDVVDQEQVDEGGRYRFNVSPGAWAVRVWDAHGHRGQGRVVVEADQDADLSVELSEPEGGH
jgi:hypothetical protein